MSGAQRGRAPLGRIFGIPLILAALTLFGLVAALIADGAWDAVSAMALAIPVAIVCWKVARPGTATPRTPRRS